MLHKAIDGAGRPIVFFHGFAASYRYWDDVVMNIDQEKYRAIRLDLMGFGHSHKPSGRDYSVDDHVDGAHADMFRDAHEPVRIVGHSMGALIAIRFAARFPELVESLVLINPPLFITKQDAALGISRGMSLHQKLYVSKLGGTIHYAVNPILSKITPDGLNPLAKVLGLDYLLHTRHSFKSSLARTILEYRPLSDLTRIRHGISLIYSSKDQYYDERAHIAAESIERIETIPITGRHHAALRNPKQVADIIMRGY